MAEILADDCLTRRSPSGRERRCPARSRCPDRKHASIADVGVENITSTVIATRGERLALIRIRSSMRGSTPGEFTAEMLSIVEIDADNRTRPPPSSSTPTTSTPPSRNSTPGTSPAKRPPTRTRGRSTRGSTPRSTGTNFPRRRRTGSTSTTAARNDRGALIWPASLRAIWDIAPDIRSYIEAVHRLSDLGAVVTAAVYGTSQEGFDAEWREIDLFTVEGDWSTASKSSTRQTSTPRSRGSTSSIDRRSRVRTPGDTSQGFRCRPACRHRLDRPCSAVIT